MRGPWPQAGQTRGDGGRAGRTVALVAETTGWDDPPDDAALLELGRLTWAAILLEDYTQAVCQEVCPQRRSDATGDLAASP